MGEKFKVLNPMGFPPKILQKSLAPRPETLDGKTVYLVDCRFDDGDILIEQMANWFTENRPDIRIDVRRKSGVYTERDEALYKEIQAKGGTAVVAVGH
ncbi:MAG: hypothetical protein O3B73_04400 [bacterium]|nr:hypothetical protein [bacterium]